MPQALGGQRRQPITPRRKHRPGLAGLRVDRPRAYGEVDVQPDPGRHERTVARLALNPLDQRSDVLRGVGGGQIHAFRPVDRIVHTDRD